MWDKRKLVQLVCSGKADNATKMKNKLKNITGINSSSDTVCRALKQAGMKAITKKKKPRLLPRHQKKRKNFALRYKDWAVEGWKGVIWSDETKINRLGSDGRE